MYIYLIRHGQTEWNVQNRIQGREDIPLSEEGKCQVVRCSKAFSGKRLSAVLASPLTRAADTAKKIAEVTDSQVILDDRLVERDFGSVSGMVVDIFNPEKYGDDLEPLEDVSARMLSCINEYAKKSDGDFAVVSHGGSINALLRELSHGEIGSGKTRLKNVCVNILQRDGAAMRVMEYNLEPQEFEEKFRM